MKVKVKIYFKNKKDKLVLFVFFLDVLPDVLPDMIKAIKGLIRSIEIEFQYDFHSLIYDSGK